LVFDIKPVKIIIMLRRIVVYMLLLVIHITGYSQDKVPEGISLAFKAGNAVELSKFFNEEIELVLIDKEDLYSRKQAEQIMKQFFSENRPSAFRIIFEGGKETSRYAIGTLTVKDHEYRIYLLIKNGDNNPLIHQLRIEEEDDQNL
jgi:hypothetical protein